ncbi:hypothetical protein PQ465_09375 [Sphingobacterium oryzagri]|uniref:Uncharacterized protein n=1 Tax=Sphingobacterium oryzagri TaxID=3025669 RepID=A0ABY7WN02_9SPHI|nr:hypothetical protein [Sphingobacterium sp. KACC 22765]WDF70568.1 hypothetical protein PQ465_09375 [Sphingobacterium sp. KACC 22765]
MCREAINFPELMSFNDYGGSYDDYEDALLEVYNADLWNSNLQFAGLNVKPRVHKRFELNGKFLDWTFAHFTSKGPIDEDRELDLSRCERIGYVKLIIENAHLDCVKVYENTRFDRNGSPIISVVLWCECANAKIVLTKIQKEWGEYYVITTFYLVNSAIKINSHNKEYVDYVAANGEFQL